MTESRWFRWVVLAAAILVLNGAITFHNIWPTPAVGWSGEISVELAVCLIGLVIAHRVRGAIAPVIRRVLAALWVVLAIGRYVAVTAPALWGRELNFYWDLRFLPDVASMLAHAASTRLIFAAVAAAFGGLAFAYWLARRSFEVVASALDDRSQRRATAALAALVIAAFAVQKTGVPAPARLTFSTPVTKTYARQARFVLQAVVGSASLVPSPSFDYSLRRIADADVLLFFIESYGAVTFDRPDFSAGLEPARRGFEAAIAASGRDVVSAFVESPTFGGSSWFAHITLLSGIEVRNPDTNAMLMTQSRDTLPKVFARHGYRTVAMMPAIWSPWPEGAFYGFQEIYTGQRLTYEGPQFGWFSMSDQFVLAKLDAAELGTAGRAPVFAFFPTISTHTPFAPVPPYQPDWPRMLSPKPYDADELQAAYSDLPDWLNLGPSYVAAVRYAYETLGGYLQQHEGRDFVMVLIGDHQPPALVSGEGMPWDVPVHVIASRREVLDALLARGFQRGLTPRRPGVGKMHSLTPILLDAFSGAR